MKRGGRGWGRNTSNNNGRFSYKKIRDDQSFNFEKREKRHGNNHWTIYKSNPMDKSKVECLKCYMYRHYKSKCQTNLNMNCDTKSNFVNNKDETSLLMTCHMMI